MMSGIDIIKFYCAPMISLSMASASLSFTEITAKVAPSMKILSDHNKANYTYTTHDNNSPAGYQHAYSSRVENHRGTYSRLSSFPFFLL